MTTTKEKKLVGYRIWHKPTKTMQQIAVISFVNGYVDTFGSKLYPEPIYRIPLDEVVLMQFTGLYDKNNKPIYEGDIIEYDETMIGGIKDIGQIVWLNDYTLLTNPGFALFTKKGFAIGDSFMGSTVLGDIFENPELLEAKE